MERLETKIEAVAAVIQNGGKFLITKRLENSPMGHCWEFPGGKMERGESIEQAIIRECREEIAVRIKPLRRLQEVWYDYPHGKIHLHFVLCEIESGTPQPIECREVRWIEPHEFPSYEFPPADRGVIEDLLAME
ncbi:MAG: 8-oxo-dGTP diphosphatase MutT [Deltaproteobacteria bacterium]|nr:8-oxo-dGTP diphosphatase MutT [Deltaproteobacteria bacterium]MBI4373915.1 8-oxo-dGTP diphosphatase MutT [Deltaproteobacteria bacterium]